MGAIRVHEFISLDSVIDIHGLPAARLAVVPGTTHVGLCDRAEWVVPMIAEFLGHAGG